MKYLMKLEGIIKDKGSINIGYYAIANDKNRDGELNDFLNNNIGRVYYIGVDYSLAGGNMYYIKYKNISSNLKQHFNTEKKYRGFNDREILFSSKRKGDVEAYLYAKKYNL